MPFAASDHNLATVVWHTQHMRQSVDTTSRDTRPRRRRQSQQPRRRRIVVRFDDVEYDAICVRAGEAGVAVAAWLAQAGTTAAEGHHPVGLSEFLQLNADVRRLADSAACDPVVVAQALGRIGDAVDEIMRARGTRPS